TIPAKNGQSVETANGHQTIIKDIAEFSISLNSYTDRIQAYVFDTKFDVILGRSWLAQVQPIPDWINGTWTIKIRNDSKRLTMIHPLTAQSIQQSIDTNSPNDANPVTNVQVQSQETDEAVTPDELEFLISAKQLDNLFKKKNVEECYLIDISAIYEPDSLAVLVDDKLSKQGQNSMTLTVDQEWCEEFAAKYPGVFKGVIDSLPPIRDTVEDMIIFKPGTVPESRPPYRMSPLELQELRRQLDTLLKQGLIEPTSSPYGSPVLFVKRADDKKLRMVCDFRLVNKISISHRIPIPRIDECLSMLHGSNFFTTLDLQSGFHQQRLTDSDSEKTTINTRYGQFKWKVIPFGLRNSGAQFQKMLNVILKDYIDVICLLYIDDILIFTKGDDVNLHKKHVDLVLGKLAEAGLVVNKTKCKFNRKQVTFLGHDVIANTGVRPAKKKTEAITNWPCPTNVQEVRQFIGLCQFYKAFLPNFASIATPITDLTKGNGHKLRQINWTNECEQAFQHIKTLMTTAPTLLNPCMTLPWRIECDASDFAAGMVLLQPDPKSNHEWKPVAYESRKFSKEERKYSVQERECLSILHALRTWRCFIDGNDYEVFTDHEPLKTYQDTSKVSPRLVRWMTELSLYSPKILYKKGIDNIVPDLLSRRDGPNCVPNTESMEPRYLYEPVETVAAIISNSSSNSNDILITDPLQDWPLFYFKDASLWPESLKDHLLKKQQDFIVRDQHIWKKMKNENDDKLVKFIPFKRRVDLVEDFHKGFGHQGKATVYQLMKSRFWWPKMINDVTLWLSRCPECQLHSRKESNTHHAPMKPLEVPAPFHRWHIDFIGELPTTKNGNRWIIMAVDYSTNWPIARALKNATADEIVKFLYEEIVMRFSCPVELVSDRGANFMSKILNQYMKKIKSKHIFTSAFHPRTNSKCERLNQTFKHMITKYVKGEVHSWDEFVDTALFSCRIRKHATTGLSPFFMTYGVDPVLPGDSKRPFMDPMTEEDPELIAEDTL
ncbi:hypothetical protein INT47_001388, partial [Mucor saturninus]